MELKKIKELMSAMGPSGITKLVIKEGEFELQLEKASEEFSERVFHTEHHGMLEQMRPSLFTPIRAQDLPQSQALPVAPEKPKSEDNSKFVASPMVGTFYSSPSPEDPPFVKVGDRVEAGTVVCIVEAMKVMNEVKAGVAGVISEVLLTNGHPVEFGTKIFRVS